MKHVQRPVAQQTMIKDAYLESPQRDVLLASTCRAQMTRTQRKRLRTHRSHDPAA